MSGHRRRMLALAIVSVLAAPPAFTTDASGSTSAKPPDKGPFDQPRNPGVRVQL